MKSKYCIAMGLIVLAGCIGTQSTVKLEPDLHRMPDVLALQQENYEGDIYPFFEEFCFSCHGVKKQEGGVNLETATLVSSIGKSESTWERVLSMLESGQMPPEKKRQPTDFDRDDVAKFIEEELDAAIQAMRPDPGRVTTRRLNRQEYNNTIRDLLGINSNPSRSFPVDDSGYGFDNIGDVLSLSPLLLEKYLATAEEIVGASIAKEYAPAKEGEGIDRYIFVCGHERGNHQRGCANTILRQFASKAYRRPVTKSELRGIKGLVKLVEREGDSFEDGIRLAIEAILVSPNFLFRIEQDSDDLHYINNFELASRLSYFLWSTMPDEELLTLARSEDLRAPEVLSEQIFRMIADEKSHEFITNFTGQWLELRNIDSLDRKDEIYPDFSRSLRNAMRRESQLFFETLLRENLSILNFLDSDFTFVNERLAKHYGIEGVTGKNHRRIQLEGGQRGGVLTQASVLTLTSFFARTSPVVRGAWILENILGEVPPPPPDDVPRLVDDPRKTTGTLRQQLEAHRSNPSCASCHNRFDALGFGLENYDAIGAWRTTENDHPVDSSGVLPSGEAFNGSEEMRRILLDHPKDFVRCFTEKMLTYALGRGVEDYDRPVVAGIEERLAENGYRFQSLILEIVMSVPFQLRRGEGEPSA